MINVLRSEWIKIRTVRMNTVLFICAVAIPLVIIGLTGALIAGEALEVGEDEVTGIITGTSLIPGILLGVVGASSITGEFGFNTIRPTFAATPRRTRVLVGKAIIIAALAAIAQALVVLMSYSLLRGILSMRGIEIRDFQSFTTFDVDNIGRVVTYSPAPPIIGIIVFATVVSLLGYGIGLLIHSTPAAVSILILWPLLLESLIAGILSTQVDNPERFLPYLSGIQLGNPLSGDSSIGRVSGGAYFAAVTLALVALGIVRTNRSDA